MHSIRYSSLYIMYGKDPKQWIKARMQSCFYFYFQIRIFQNFFELIFVHNITEINCCYQLNQRFHLFKQGILFFIQSQQKYDSTSFFQVVFRNNQSLFFIRHQHEGKTKENNIIKFFSKIFNIVKTFFVNFNSRIVFEQLLACYYIGFINIHSNYVNFFRNFRYDSMQWFASTTSYIQKLCLIRSKFQIIHHNDMRGYSQKITDNKIINKCWNFFNDVQHDNNQQQIIMNQSKLKNPQYKNAQSFLILRLIFVLIDFLKLDFIRIYGNIYNIIQINNMSNISNHSENQNSSNQLKDKTHDFTSEDVFKIIITVLSIILALCIKRILEFRHYCQEKNYYVFSVDSLIYCGLGFMLVLIVKYSYFYLFFNKIESVINTKYIGEERIMKTKSVLKLSYDSMFYICITIYAFWQFRNQPWFPFMIGGSGQCSAIYNNYPDWPNQKRKQMEIYFMIQLGVHAFSVFEMLTIKRNTQRKFYEYLLHHFVAASLILCSMMCNQIAAGVIIVIVHDFSDIFLASSRAYAEINNHKNIIIIPMIAGLLIFWIYMRIIVFPFCLLANVFINKPTVRDDWYMIYYPYMYLLCMAFVLFGMHIYWTYYILKSTFKSLAKKKAVNEHEKLRMKHK